MWLLIPVVVAVAVAILALVWWSSGRARTRMHRPTDAVEAERIRKAGMIETDDLPGRSGFLH